MSQPLKVWSKFSVTKDTNDITLSIVEAPPELLNDVAQLIFSYFARAETSLRVAGVIKNKESMKEFIELLKDEALIALACYVDNGDNEMNKLVVGVSLMSMKGEEKTMKFEPQTEELRKWFELKNYAMGKYDVKAEQGVDKYYHGSAVVVHPDYRRLGIAQKLYEVRRLVSKRDGVTLISAIMTSRGSQKAAQRDGWETVYEYNSEEYEKKYGLTFENNAKFMIARV